MTVNEDAFSLMDEWGPEKIVCVSDRKTGMRGVLVLDNTAMGMGKAARADLRPTGSTSTTPESNQEPHHARTARPSRGAIRRAGHRVIAQSPYAAPDGVQAKPSANAER